MLYFVVFLQIKYKKEKWRKEKRKGRTEQRCAEISTNYHFKAQGLVLYIPKDGRTNLCVDILLSVFFLSCLF